MSVIIRDLDLNDLFQTSPRGDNRRDQDENTENNEWATHNFGSHLSLINLMVACGFLGVSAPRFME